MEYTGLFPQNIIEVQLTRGDLIACDCDNVSDLEPAQLHLQERPARAQRTVSAV